MTMGMTASELIVSAPRSGVRADQSPENTGKSLQSRVDLRM